MVWNVVFLVVNFLHLFFLLYKRRPVSSTSACPHSRIHFTFWPIPVFHQTEIMAPGAWGTVILYMHNLSVGFFIQAVSDRKQNILRFMVMSCKYHLSEPLGGFSVERIKPGLFIMRQETCPPLPPTLCAAALMKVSFRFNFRYACTPANCCGRRHNVVRLSWAWYLTNNLIGSGVAWCAIMLRQVVHCKWQQEGSIKRSDLKNKTFRHFHC